MSAAPAQSQDPIDVTATWDYTGKENVYQNWSSLKLNLDQHQSNPNPVSKTDHNPNPKSNQAWNPLHQYIVSYLTQCFGLVQGKLPYKDPTS